MSDDMKRMEINHEDTKNTKIKIRKTFVLFVSSWLISGGVSVGPQRPDLDQ
jgi:hypothetical protein